MRIQLKSKVPWFLQDILANRKFFYPFSKRVGYIGWLGKNNLGDEAMYFAFCKLFENLKVFPFKYTDKIRLYEKYMRQKAYRAVFLGGGTLINYKRSYLESLKLAQQFFEQTFVFGSGVNSPEFWSKIQGSVDNLKEWVDCLSRCKFVGVRGPLSKKILDQAGLYNAKVIGDPALYLADKKIEQKKKIKRIGINLGISYGRVWGNEEEILNYIVRFAKVISNDGWNITLFPVWKEDLEYVEEAARRIGNSVLICYEYKSVERSMDFLRSCDVFMGEKLHSVILSMCAYTPSIMLEYRPKCLDFMMSMDLEEFNVRTDSLSIDLLVHLLDKLYTNLEFYQKKIEQKVNYYKNIQSEKRTMISKLI